MFIGPCVAKKDEAQYYEGIVDAVLTFDELTAWLKSENIELKQEINANGNSRARFFPTTGGILKTLSHENPELHIYGDRRRRKTVYPRSRISKAENCTDAL